MDHKLQPWLGVKAAGPMLKPRDAAAYVGISISSFYTAVAKGVLPTPLKIAGGQRTGVPRNWLDAAIANFADEVAA